MASPSTVITEGFGSFGSVYALPTDGYGTSAPPAGITTRTDDFNRTNNPSSLGTPSDGGSPYVIYQGVFLTAVYGIFSNQAYVSAGDTYGAAVLESSSPNATIEITPSAITGFAAVVFRASDANNYLFFYFQTGSNAAYLYKRVDGATTQIGTATVTIANGDTVKVQASGSAITVYINGSQQGGLDTTETFNEDATLHGFMLTTTGDKLDDLVITSLDATGLEASFVSSNTTSITLKGVKGEGPFQWYRSPTFGFSPGGGNILSGQTGQPIADSASLSAGTVYEYAIVATGSSETARARAALGIAPLIFAMIGDSVTLGAGGGVTGDPPPMRAAKMFAKNGGTSTRQVKGYNQGIIGAKTGDWISGSSNLLGAKPIFHLGGVTHVMITLGINDASAVVSAADYGTNLASCANDLVSEGFTVILNYPTGIDDATNANRMAAYLPYIDALVNGTTIRAGDKDGWRYFAEHPDELIDGIHQLDTGCESWSVMIATALSRVIDGIPGQGSTGAILGRVFTGM